MWRLEVRGTPRTVLRSRAYVLGFAVLLAACASDDDAALVAAAERIRHLSFAAVPPIEHLTREEYTRTSAADAAAIPDDRIAEYRGVFGRLGYFSANADVRAATAQAAAFYGAFYDQHAKRIRIIGNTEPAVVVHELVHALQDQHFDLTTFFDAAESTDESLARRAVVEGDATIAQLWNEAERIGEAPDRKLASSVFDGYAEYRTADAWQGLDAPKVFAAREAFVYGYGARYIARQIGMPLAPSRRALYYAGRDEAFTQPPRSTQEIIAEPRGDDPIVDVGLHGLPPWLADTHAVAFVDRLGEWYMRVLDASAGPPGRYSSDAPFTPEAWDGDQLVVLAARGSDGRPSGPPLAVIWTSAWDAPLEARGFAALLAYVHALPPLQWRYGTRSDGRSEAAAKDGEWTHLRVSGNRVVFVKNLDAARAERVADAALGIIESATYTALTHRAVATMQRLP